MIKDYKLGVNRCNWCGKETRDWDFYCQRSQARLK